MAIEHLQTSHKDMAETEAKMSSSFTETVDAFPVEQILILTRPIARRVIHPKDVSDWNSMNVAQEYEYWNMKAGAVERTTALRNLASNLDHIFARDRLKLQARPMKEMLQSLGAHLFLQDYLRDFAAGLERTVQAFQDNDVNHFCQLYEQRPSLFVSRSVPHPEAEYLHIRGKNPREEDDPRPDTPPFWQESIGSVKLGRPSKPGQEDTREPFIMLFEVKPLEGSFEHGNFLSYLQAQENGAARYRLLGPDELEICIENTTEWLNPTEEKTINPSVMEQIDNAITLRKFRSLNKAAYGYPNTKRW